METSADAGERLRIALELFGAAESIMRQNLRRRHPKATEREIEVLLQRWLLKQDPEGSGSRNAA